MGATEDEDEVALTYGGMRDKSERSSKMLYRGPPTSTRLPWVRLWARSDYDRLRYCYD
jgi:hypothetical protein